MKRVFTMFLAGLLLLLSFPLSGVAAESSGTVSETEVIQVVRMLGIMNGDQYGNLNLDKAVTRAEFIKMAVSASIYKDSVATGTNLTSPFPDVRNTHWAAGFVKIGVEQGWVNGYLDGTFRPDNPVKLEEAVNISLKLLGYTASDFTGTYPDAQLAKYTSLEMNNGISATKGTIMTRRDCMRLLYNTLGTKTRTAKNGTSGTSSSSSTSGTSETSTSGNAGGTSGTSTSDNTDSTAGASTSTNKYYCTTLGYTADSNGHIDYLALLMKKTEGPFTILDDTYKNRLGFSLDDATVYRDGEKVAADALSVYDVYYYSDTLGTIWSYTDKIIGVVQDILPSRENPISVKVSGVSYSLGNSGAAYEFSTIGNFKKDDFIMLLLDRSGAVADAYHATPELYNAYADTDSDTVSLLNSTVEGPVVIKDLSQVAKLIPLDLSKTLIVYDNKAIDQSELKQNDVVYYSTAFGRAWVYRDTVTGILDAVSPNVNAPTAVTVKGKAYTLQNAAVKYKFSAYGAFKKDDFVTLLLGREGNAVDVVEGQAGSVATDDEDYFEILNSTIEGPVIVKTTGDWKTEIPFDTASASFYKDSVRISSVDIKTNDVLYYSKAFGTVWVYRNTVSGVCEAINPGKEAPSSVTLSGKVYTLDTTGVKQKFSSYGTFETDNFVTLLLGRSGGVVDALYGDLSDSSIFDDDNLSYSQLVASSTKGPVIVKDGGWQTSVKVNLPTAIVYRGDKQISVNDITSYDVLYYSTVLNTIWVYNTKKSGMLEVVSPNKTAPTAITVSGTVYQLETSSAKYAVSNFGTYKLGDRMTVLLGKDGGVAEIISIQNVSKSIYGVITSYISNKTYTNSDGTTYKANAIKILDTSGVEHEYEHSTIGYAIGAVVRVNFNSNTNDPIYTITVLSSSGDIESLQNAMYNNKYADDVGILDTYCSIDRQNVFYKKINPSRLDKLILSNKNVLYFNLNAQGEIENLILNDYTGDIYEYTFFNRLPDNTCKYWNNGEWKSLSGSTLETGAIGFVQDSGSFKKSFNLYSKTTLETLDDLSASSINMIYTVPMNVKVFIRDGADYIASSISEVADAGYILIGYYTSDNQIRVIIASKK